MPVLCAVLAEEVSPAHLSGPSSPRHITRSRNKRGVRTCGSTTWGRRNGRGWWCGVGIPRTPPALRSRAGNQKRLGNRVSCRRYPNTSTNIAAARITSSFAADSNYRGHPLPPLEVPRRRNGEGPFKENFTFSRPIAQFIIHHSFRALTYTCVRSLLNK